MNIRVNLCTVLMMVSGILVVAQSTTAPPATQQENAELDNQKLEILRQRNSFITDYLLGPGDIIDIQVLGVPELTKKLQINQAGEILLPFVEVVRVDGLTIFELQKKLESLLSQTVLREPHVSVTIQEYRSQPIHVLGEVNAPGTYQLKHAMRVVDVLSLAGGFSSAAGDTCTITRGRNDGTSQRIEINLRELLDGQDFSQNTPVMAGDIIHVSKRVIRNFYVLGDVGQPGAYALAPDKDVRFSEALSTAGGYLKTAKLSDTKLIRVQENGQRTMVALDVKNILSGKSPDPLIQENDLIFVPNSRTKALGQSLLNNATGIFIQPLVWALIR
ncbi:MAG: SLBB domain-containing protein [Acidobacteria bacterium]|nr:SLBB domain-containing protein [Acidobacteriota bacterium]